LSCELTEYVTQYVTHHVTQLFCHLRERKLNGNHMLLDIEASRSLKRFNDQAKFWEYIINFSFENTPKHLEPPLHSICVPTLLLNFLSTTTRKFRSNIASIHLESPIHWICNPKLRLFILSLHSTRFLIQHYAYSFRVSISLDLFSNSTLTHFQSPL